MARIAFAWEMGGELGHAMACAALARRLHARGHHIAFMFRELHQLGAIGDTSAYDIFQAPHSLFEGRGAPIPASLADILLGCGYDRGEQVAGLLGGWLALLRTWRPDVVVSDFAPTALLAARLLRLKRVAYGNGFSIPPRLSPLPSFRFDEPIAPERVHAADAQALAAANAAIAAYGGHPLARLAEQFETDEDFLATFPELDTYGTRPPSAYWGPRFSIDAGASVHWPAGGAKRVLVYLKPSQPQLDGLIDALAASPHRVAAYIPGLEPGRAARLRSPQRIVSERPMRLEPLLRECDLCVNTGGNVCVGTLLSGVPQVVMPGQYEQYITARRVEQIGVGAWLNPAATPAGIAATLRSVLDDPRYQAAARAYAKRYASYSPGEHQRRIVARIEEIVAQPSRWGAPAAGTILTPTSKAQGTSS